MKEHFSNTCESEAIRVQFWFGRDRASLLRYAESNTKDFSKKYKCNLVASFRIPYHIERLPLQNYVFSEKKRQVKTRQVTAGAVIAEHSHCSACQKNLNHITPEYVLSPARVAYNRLKFFLVSKKLQSFSDYSHSNPKKHQVTPIKTSKPEELSQNPYLQEWGKFKEERLYQMDRVIKYLSD